MAARDPLQGLGHSSETLCRSTSRFHGVISKHTTVNLTVRIGVEAFGRSSLSRNMLCSRHVRPTRFTCTFHLTHASRSRKMLQSMPVTATPHADWRQRDASSSLLLQVWVVTESSWPSLEDEARLRTSERGCRLVAWHFNGHRGQDWRHRLQRVGTSEYCSAPWTKQTGMRRTRSGAYRLWTMAPPAKREPIATVVRPSSWRVEDIQRGRRRRARSSEEK